MSDEIDKEVDAILGELSASQLEALKVVFGHVEERRVRGQVRKSDQVHDCIVTVKCTLCGFQEPKTFKSISELPSVYLTPTCSHCKEELSKRSVEELVDICIKVADGCFSLVKEAKNV